MKLFSKPVCPHCGREGRKTAEEPKGSGVALFLLSELLFYGAFGLCLALGMWDVLAGAISTAVCGVVYWLWYRGKEEFLCASCNFTYVRPRPHDKVGS